MSTYIVEQLGSPTAIERNKSFLGKHEELPLSYMKKLMGENYYMIIRAAYNLPDTFGLCGILAEHASGILTTPGLWKNVVYDPLTYKEIFEVGLMEKAKDPKKKMIRLGSAVYLTGIMFTWEQKTILTSQLILVRI